MNIFAHFEMRVRAAIQALMDDGLVPADVAIRGLTVETPRAPSHGDVATNAAMVLSKAAKSKPRDLAEAIAGKLAAMDDVMSAEVAGPGFINLKVSDTIWSAVTKAAIAEGAAFGRSELGAGERVNVEYVSANPTGPLHVGHCRGAVFGDALANLLDFTGYDVTREYYINDAGAQVEVLARSVFLRYREALGEDIGAIPDGLYPGDYLKPVGEALAGEYGDALKAMDEAEWLAIAKAAAIDAMMDQIRDDLAALNIAHDVFFSERSLKSDTHDRVASTIDDLKGRGLVYLGRLPKPKGETGEDWEDREQLLFKSTEFGDDLDRGLVKSNGDYTYFAFDMAYHADKYARGFNHQIDVWGADHGGYVKRMTSAVKALSEGDATLEVRLCQLVKLFRNGEPVRMSKRAGQFVTLRDVVEEVGTDIVRFIMLTRKNDAPLDFDFAKVTEQKAENPVFYVQYAHARAFSIMAKAHEAFPAIPAEGEALAGDPSLLTDEGERGIIRAIAQYPKLIESAATAHEPHRIAFYLAELAAAFHGQYNRGKEAPHLRYIRDDDQDTTLARMMLVRAVANVIASGLGVLGVHAPREMR